MNEENTIDTEAMTAEDYISELEKIRGSTVSREEYARICKENKQLANALTNGSSINKEPEQKPDLSELRKKVFTDKKKNNLEYFNDVLKFRSASLDQTGNDPFLASTHNYTPTDNDRESSEKIADQIQDCIDYAAGDPTVFTIELQRRCGIKNNLKRGN